MFSGYGDLFVLAEKCFFFVSLIFFDTLVSFPFITWVVLVLEACECLMVGSCSHLLSLSGSVGRALDLFSKVLGVRIPGLTSFLSNSVWSPSFAFMVLVSRAGHFIYFFENLLWVVWNWMGMIKFSICQKFEVLNH